MTARLAGGPYHGLVVEIDTGATTHVVGPALILFGPAFDALPEAERDRLKHARYEYSYVGVESVDDPAATDEGPHRAVFQLMEPDA